MQAAISHGAAPEKSLRAAPLSPHCCSLTLPSPVGQERDTPSANRVRLDSLPPLGLQPGCGLRPIPGDRHSLSELTAATFPGRCLSNFPAGMRRKLNFIISLTFALCIGSLELSPHHSLGALRVGRLKARCLKGPWLGSRGSWARGGHRAHGFTSVLLWKRQSQAVPGPSHSLSNAFPAGLTQWGLSCPHSCKAAFPPWSLPKRPRLAQPHHRQLCSGQRTHPGKAFPSF